jgi:hypothetical protein
MPADCGNPRRFHRSAQWKKSWMTFSTDSSMRRRATQATPAGPSIGAWPAVDRVDCLLFQRAMEELFHGPFKTGASLYRGLSLYGGLPTRCRPPQQAAACPTRSRRAATPEESAAKRSPPAGAYVARGDRRGSDRLLEFGWSQRLLKRLADAKNGLISAVGPPRLCLAPALPQPRLKRWPTRPKACSGWKNQKSRTIRCRNS